MKRRSLTTACDVTQLASWGSRGVLAVGAGLEGQLSSTRGWVLRHREGRYLRGQNAAPEPLRFE